MAMNEESISQSVDPSRHNPSATNAGLVEIQIQYRAIADFKLDARNPRQHSQRQVKQLADSIQEFAFVMPVVTDDKGQVVIGHGRVLAAKKLGMRRIPVVTDHSTINRSRAPMPAMTRRILERPCANTFPLP